MSEAERTVLYWRIGALIFVKLATSVLTLYYFPSWHALWVIFALSLPWVFAGAFYGARHSIRRYRGWQLAQFRKRLIWEEWHVEEDVPDNLWTRIRD